MSELRAGGLALITGARTQEGKKFIGKCVMIERFVQAGERYLAPSGRSVRNTSPNLSAIVTGDVSNVSTGEYGWAQIARHHLLPIDGKDFSHEDQRQRELTNG